MIFHNNNANNFMVQKCIHCLTQVNTKVHYICEHTH